MLPILSLVIFVGNDCMHVLQSLPYLILLGCMERVMRATFSISEETECRVWHRYMTDTFELLSEPKQTLQDAGLYNGQVN